MAEQATFIEVAYLLIYGELPTADQLEDFNGKIARRMMLDERMRELFRAFPRGPDASLAVAQREAAVQVDP